MKKMLLLFALLLTLSAMAQNRVILNPDYDKPEGVGYLEPKRVELTDTATVFHMSVNCGYVPYVFKDVWLKADGKKYAFRGGRRISTFGQGKPAYEKDETIYFRNSKGDTTLVLHIPKEEPLVELKKYEHTSIVDSLVMWFDPLPADATVFDFSTDILNINLTKSVQYDWEQRILPT